MIFDQFLPARVPAGSGIPETDYMQHTSGSTFKLGAILVFNAGEVEEGGVNPTGIVGASLAPAGKAPGFEAANNPVVSTGRQRNVDVARANRLTRFAAGLVNGSSTRIAPVLATHINQQYGLTKHGNNWFVDVAKTGADARVEVVAISDLWGTRGGVIVKFLEAHLAAP